MNILMVMTIPVTLTLVLLFILFFFSAVRSGQFEDLETPAHTPFLDDEDNNSEITHQSTGQNS